MANKDSISKPNTSLKDEIKYNGESKNNDTQHKFKIYVGIDFGTDGCGLAYALNDGTSYIHNTWKDVEPTQKPRTAVLFDNNRNVQCIGNQAAMQYITSMSNTGWKLFERFKMSLFETPKWTSEIRNVSHSVKKVDIFADQIQATNDPKLFEFSETVFVAQLKFLREQAIQFMKKNFKRKKKMKYDEQIDIQWILTVPAIWSDKAKEQMKQWAIKAGLINNKISNQLKIVYEPDCASLSIQTAILNNLNKNNNNDDEKKSNNIVASHRPKININAPFNAGDKYILVDVGGGTCDVACHEIMGEFQIAEVLHPSGGPWGAAYIDEEFKKLLRNVFCSENGIDWIDEFIGKNKQNLNMYQQLLQNFIEMSKPTYYDYVAMNKMYHDITIPYNFANFLVEKFEEKLEEFEENNASNNNVEGNNDYETKELIDVINEFLSLKSFKLYNNSEYIKFNEINNYGYALSLHNNLWNILFDSIINEIILHCKNILSKIEMKDCKYIFLVGGFANSKYFQYRMNSVFSDNNNNNNYKLEIITPQLPQLCVVDGACRYGLQPNFMKIRRLSKTYGIQSNKLKSKLDILKFPKGFIARKSYHNKQKNKDFVENCFNAFVGKNQAISIDDKPIRRPVYKIKHDQKQVNIIIYSSNKQYPQTADPLEIKKFNDDNNTGEDCNQMAKFTVYFDQNSNDKIWVEFKYSDTLLTVHAYPDKQPNKRQQINIEYQ